MAQVGAAGGRISAGVGSNLIGVHAADRNQEATVYVGNLDPQVTDDVMWEVFVQAGPVGELGLNQPAVIALFRDMSVHDDMPSVEYFNVGMMCRCCDAMQLCCRLFHSHGNVATAATCSVGVHAQRSSDGAAPGLWLCRISLCRGCGLLH